MFDKMVQKLKIWDDKMTNCCIKRRQKNKPKTAAVDPNFKTKQFDIKETLKNLKLQQPRTT